MSNVWPDLPKAGHRSKAEMAHGYLNSANEGLRYTILSLGKDHPLIPQVEDLMACVDDIRGKLDG